MECRSTRELLGSYLDMSLAGAAKAAVDEHLKSCAECRAYLADLEKTMGHLRELETVEPPPWLTQKVMASIRDEKKPASLLTRIFRPVFAYIPAEAAATVLIAVAAVLIFRSMQHEIAPDLKQPKKRETVGVQSKKAPVPALPRKPASAPPKEDRSVARSPAREATSPPATKRYEEGLQESRGQIRRAPVEAPIMKKEKAVPPPQPMSDAASGRAGKDALNESGTLQSAPAYAPAAGAARQESGKGPETAAPAPRRLQPQETEKVIWNDPEITTDDVAKVTRVTLVQETRNTLIFDAEYYLSPAYDGDASIGLYPDISDWSVGEARALKGKHTVSILVSRIPGAKPETSHNLRIEISGYRNRSFEGPLYRRIVPYEKRWEGR